MNNVEMMPNFFIIGAAKAGTTTLYALLRRHPEIFLTVIKEPQFFCNEELFQKGIDYYLNTYFKHSSRFVARGEATPHYLYFDKVAKRIAKEIPKKNQRFIIILRDPVERAYSLYWNMVAEGVEELSFREAIFREEERCKDPSLEYSCALRYRYVSSSLYARQIRRYFKYFEREQFLFLFFDDLIKDEGAVLKNVFQFLGVDADVIIQSGGAHNRSGMPRFKCLHNFLRKPLWVKSQVARFIPRTTRYRITSKLLELNKQKRKYEKLDSSLRLELIERFREDIRDLERITNRDLSRWFR